MRFESYAFEAMEYLGLLDDWECLWWAMRVFWWRPLQCMLMGRVHHLQGLHQWCWFVMDCSGPWTAVEQTMKIGIALENERTYGNNIIITHCRVLGSTNPFSGIVEKIILLHRAQSNGMLKVNTVETQSLFPFVFHQNHMLPRCTNWQWVDMSG